MSRSEMVLSLFLSQWGGTHPGAWRSPNAPVNPATDFDHVRRLVQTAERGKLHTIFLADNHALYPQRDPNVLAKTANAVRFEPFTLCAALAVSTDRIGLAATVSTTYNEPYAVARKFSTLDHISGGRSAWNVVISGSPDDSQNFGQDQELDSPTRYRRAAEFVDVVTGLWDSWDQDAFGRDKESGQYFDVAKMHRLDHRGEFFSVRGPLNAERPVQGHPVIAQAGASETGLAFATRIADMVFGVGLDLEAGAAFYDDVKARTVSARRDPDDVIVMTGITAILGLTQEHAQRRAAEIAELADASAGLDRLNFAIEFDASRFPLDGPLPDDIPVTTHGDAAVALQSRYIDRARKEGLTIRELAQIASGDLIMPLGVTEMADYMERHFGTTADGFNLSFGDTHESLEMFVDHVVPELRRRGIYHDDYRGSTLRENLGLGVPRSRYASTEHDDRLVVSDRDAPQRAVAAPARGSQLDDFTELLSSDYGRDVTEMADRLFDRSAPGLLRHPRGRGLVAYRHADLSILAANPRLGGPATDSITEPSTVAIMKDHIFTMNLPLHLPQRRLFSRHFTPRAQALRAHAAQTAVEQITAEMRGAGRIDLQADFAVRVTARFWGLIIGLTAEEEERCVDIFAQDFSISFMQNTNAEQSARLIEVNKAYLDIVPPAIMRSLRAGDNDVLNALAADLDTVELEGKSENIGLLLGCTLIDGFHTLAVAITNLVYALFTRPDAVLQVRNDPSLAEQAFAEGTRLEPPLLSTPRFALEDTELDGLPLPEGTPITMMWILGNRDPSVFDQPHEYQLARKGPARAFGGGGRICPGGNVARLLGIKTVKALTAPGIEVSLHADTHRWATGTSLHELESVPVSLIPAASW